ncbi:MAG: hypothetical protein Ct9H300mP1_35800 [Planctomycetaceae bacterium]|nr:MAG: hypothetical protein Ct9H300mP1_35800 [Planctomycetaceae bacterium]
MHGGLCEWVNVGQFDYEWGPQKLGSQTIPLKMTGEYNYVKSFWALNEVLVATLMTFELTQTAWAARYFTMARRSPTGTFPARPTGRPVIVWPLTVGSASCPAALGRTITTRSAA